MLQWVQNKIAQVCTILGAIVDWSRSQARNDLTSSPSCSTLSNAFHFLFWEEIAQPSGRISRSTLAKLCCFLLLSIRETSFSLVTSL